MWNYTVAHPEILLIVTTIAITVCTALLLFPTGGDGDTAPERPMDDPACSALQILNERFAKGEVERREYEERKRALLTVMTPGGQA